MKHTLKKSLALLFTLLLAASALAGCLPKPAQVTPAATAEPAPAGSGDATAPAAPVEVGDLALEVWYAVSGTSGEKFVEQAEAFQAENGNIKLNLSYSGGSSDTATKVSAALLAGNGAPDVALMYAGPLYTGARGNYVVSELMQREGFNAGDIFPGMWDYCRYGTGNVCAVPYGISTQVMYYNKDILAAAGVDMTKPPQTWAEFYDVCKLCLEKGNINGTTDFSAFDVTDTKWLFKSMLMQHGNEIITEKDGVLTPLFTDEKALDVANYWKSLVDSGIMAAGEHNVAENKFLSGNLAFLAMSSNRISRWTDVDINIGAIEMPHFETQQLALGGNVLVILTQDPERIEAAWQLIEYLLQPEQNVEFALATGYLPVRQSELELDAVKNAIAENEMYAVAFNQLQYTFSYFHFEQMGTMDLLLGEALGLIEKGVQTPQEALDGALEDLLDEISLS